MFYLCVCLCVCVLLLSLPALVYVCVCVCICWLILSLSLSLAALDHVCVRLVCTGPSVTTAIRATSISAVRDASPASATTTPYTATLSQVSLGPPHHPPDQPFLLTRTPLPLMETLKDSQTGRFKPPAIASYYSYTVRSVCAACTRHQIGHLSFPLTLDLCPQRQQTADRHTSSDHMLYLYGANDDSSSLKALYRAQSLKPLEQALRRRWQGNTPF